MFQALKIHKNYYGNASGKLQSLQSSFTFFVIWYLKQACEIQWGRYNYCLYLTDEETDTQGKGSAQGHTGTN